MIKIIGYKICYSFLLDVTTSGLWGHDFLAV